MNCSREFGYLKEAAEGLPKGFTLTLLPEGAKVSYRGPRAFMSPEMSEIVPWSRLIYSVGNPVLWAVERIEQTVQKQVTRQAG